MQITYTHRGWFGLCPVFVGDLNTDAPAVEERHWSLAWLLTLSEWLFDLAFTIKCALDDEYEPAWPIRIQGELEKPFTRTVPHEI